MGFLHGVIVNENSHGILIFSAKPNVSKTREMLLECQMGSLAKNEILVYVQSVKRVSNIYFVFTLFSAYQIAVFFHQQYIQK